MNFDRTKMQKNKRKWLLYAALFVLSCLILATGYFVYRHIKSKNPKPVHVDQEIDRPVSSDQNNAVDESQTPTPAAEERASLPESLEIKMQFASQAPYADWGEPYQNACEEASIIIDRYYLDKLNLTKDVMNQQILAMVDWQYQNWQGHDDLTSEKTLELAKEFYGLSGEIVYNYDADTIKKYLAQGLPVLIPADGRKLGNPNFKNGGPEYHMLVIKGYTPELFITNDPGTRKGEGYTYSYQTILNSIKNPSGGAKSIIVLYR